MDVDNFMAWSHEIEYLLRFHDLWGLVVPENHPKAETQIASSAIGPMPGMQTRSGLTLGARKTETDPDAQGSGSAAIATEAGKVTAAALAWEKTAAEQRQRCERARVIIMLNVRAHHSAKLRRHRTSRDLWAALREEFHPKRTSRGNARRRQLNSLKMGANEMPIRYFNRAWDIFALLQEVDITVDDDWLLGALLGGPPSKYEYTLTSMEELNDITVCKALAMLRAADVQADRFAEDSKKEKGAETALAAAAEEDQRPQRDRYRNTRCHKCQQLGHIQRFCRSGKETAKTVATLPPVGEEEEDEVATAGMVTLDRDQDDDEPGYAMLAFTTCAAAADEQGCALVGHSAAYLRSSELGQAWAVDSGASHHMCWAAMDLTDLYQGRGVTFTLADGIATRATTRGTAELRVNGTKVTLHDVPLVPGMKIPLFSVRTASRAGFTTGFSDTGVIICQAGNTILQGTTASGIYVLHLQRAGGRAKALAASAVTPSLSQPTATSADVVAAAPPVDLEEAPTPPMGGPTGAPAPSPTTTHKPSGGQETAAGPQPRGGVDAKAAL